VDLEVPRSSRGGGTNKIKGLDDIWSNSVVAQGNNEEPEKSVNYAERRLVPATRMRQDRSVRAGGGRAKQFLSRLKAGWGDMAETWWTLVQATEWVRAHRPCNSMDAYNLVRSRAQDGGVPARYRACDDGHTVPIEPSEWRDGEWIGWARQEELGFGAGLLEVDASAVQRLFTPQPTPVSKGGGRPPREIVSRLLVLAGMWIDEHGIPVAGSGEQAALERFLAKQAGDQIKAESRIREIAVQAIGFAIAHRKAGN
jgi:hypothetical protein